MTPTVSAPQMLGKGIEYSKDIEDLVVGFAHILRPIHSVNKNVCSTDIKETVRSILHLIQKVTKLIIGHRSMTETGELSSHCASSEVSVSEYASQ